MDRGAWCALVQGVEKKSDMTQWLSDNNDAQLRSHKLHGTGVKIHQTDLHRVQKKDL